MSYLLAAPNTYGCHDPQCLDSTWDHDCPVVPTVDLAGLPAEQAFNLGALTAELIAEAEARGYQRAIDALWGIATRNGNPSAEASYFARRLVSEASAQTAIRSGESTE